MVAKHSMEVNEYNLDLAGGRNHDIKPSTNFTSLNMLKDGDVLPEMVHPVHSKQREFIDHTLLAPEYIRDSNHFIMDLIDQQVVFPKPTLTDAAFVDKDQALNTDLQFQNAIFQFVNKHGQMQCTLPGDDDGVAIVENDVAVVDQSFDTKVQTNFLGLNESFLTDHPAPSKNFDLNAPSDDAVNNDIAPLINNSLASICEIGEDNKAAVHTDLRLFGEEASSSSNLLANSNHLCGAGGGVSNARKILPHKKRISKKLKGTENKSDYAFAAVELSDHHHHHHHSDKNQVVLIKQQKQTLVLFNCELCGQAASTQLEFYNHLKQHYEPDSSSTTADLVAAVAEVSSNRVKQLKHFNENSGLREKKVAQSNVGPVFPDVHLNFDNFVPVHSSVVEVMNQTSKNDDIKLLNSNSIGKCIQLVTGENDEITPQKLMNTEEIEFSDTEDMLEGIRNVVDKVSIEDTSDAVDMVASNTMRTAWFNSSDKFIENDNFPTSVTQQFAFQKVSLTNLNEITAAEKLPCFPASDKNKTTLSSSTMDLYNVKCEKLNSLSSEEIEVSDEADPTEDLELFEQMSAAEFDAINKLIDEGDKKQKYLCAQCNREFNSGNALKYHKRTHTGLRPHQCDICGKSFYAQGALKAHLRTHTGDKPFTCEHCNVKFRQMGDLKYHVTSKHNNDKLHQCEFCGKSFARKYSLILHRRIHTSERNYKCEFCPMSFRASIYLQNHRKIHTGEKPHQCATCLKKFRVSGDLKRHQHTHRNKKTNKAAKASV